MININSYINKYGKLTFDEYPFSDVDGLIFAELSMINFEFLVDTSGSIALKDIVIMDYKQTIYGSPDARANGVMLKRMIASNRYKDVKVTNIKRTFSEKNANQFYAVTFILPNNTFYIAYKGTDITIAGWREDFTLTISNRISSCDQALEYCNEVISKLDGDFIIGGHSKGAHLALYAALNCSKEHLYRLLNVYSYDGPGFPEGIEVFPNYPFIKDKINKLITHRDVIGLIYDERSDYKTVYSTGILLGGHDPFYWKIDAETGHFVTRNSVSKSSLVFAKGANMWLNQLTDEDKELGISAILAIIGKAKNIYDLIKYLGPNIARYNATIKQFPYEDRTKLKRLLVNLFECLKIAKIYYSKKPRKIYENL